ncbi:MAG: carbamoyltransferase C-terminal domain-containing protein, partial [Promethearchaeota archaeon]
KDDEIVAGIHPYDRTIRPQIVSPEFNQGYYNLIKEFHRITGIAGVLNTSFNLHGFPIVHTPKYALTVFQESGLKYLAIGSYLIEKT